MFNLTKSSEGPVLTLTEKLIMQAKLGEASSELWHVRGVASQMELVPSCAREPLGVKYCMGLGL